MPNLLSKLIFSKIGLPKNQAFLDLAAFRHKLISGNIANVSTPGFKAQGIDFKEEYARRIGETKHLSGTVTNSAHITLGSNPATSPSIERDKVQRGELNSVDIDKEISNLASNELLYSIGAKLVQRKFEGLRHVITSK